MNKKITIIATDRIGCEETISLILDENSKTFKRLKKASDEGFLRGELSEMEDFSKGLITSKLEKRCARVFGVYPYFSQSQLQRLDDFEYVINNKFYNYSLSLQIK